MVAVLAVSWPALAQTGRDADSMRSRGDDLVPSPDPTALTVDLLNREIQAIKEAIALTDKALRELVDAQFGALKEVARIQEEKASDVTRTRDLEFTRLRESIAIANADLKELIFERFNRVAVSFANVENQFVSRDTALSAALSATETAASNALTATEKAVATAGIVTKESIDQQARLFSETTNGLRVSVDDLKAAVSTLEGNKVSVGEVNTLAQRLTAIESRTAGLGEAKDTFSDNIGMIVGAGGLGLALIVFLLGRKQPEPQVRYMTNSGSPTNTTTTTQT